MILAVDARNDSIALGVKDGESWLCRFSLASQVRSADEWQFLISQMLKEKGIATPLFNYVILSSVVPALTPRLSLALRCFSLKKETPLILGPGLKTGIRIRTENPAEVGSDLVCNAVAALEYSPPPLIVIDFGTALSFTALNGAGDLVGVALAPGLELAAEALRNRGARIPQVRLVPTKFACGRNTHEAISSGLFNGYRGLVKELVGVMAKELVGIKIDSKGEAEISENTEGVSIIGTGEGPDAPLEMEAGFWVYRPQLALEGLALIADRQKAREGGP